MKDTFAFSCEAREYREFMCRKAEIARADIRAGRVHASEEIEAEFTARYGEAMSATCRARGG